MCLVQGPQQLHKSAGEARTGGPGVKRSKFNFPEHGYVAYKLKLN